MKKSYSFSSLLLFLAVVLILTACGGGANLPVINKPELIGFTLNGNGGEIDSEKREVVGSQNLLIQYMDKDSSSLTITVNFPQMGVEGYSELLATSTSNVFTFSKDISHIEPIENGNGQLVYRISSKALDTEGLEATPVTKVFVYNNLPTIEKISENPQGTISATTSLFEWEGADTDGEVTHYEYKKNDGSWEKTNETTYTWQGYTEGEHTFEVRAVDNKKSHSDSIVWSFTYSNNPPIIEKASKQPTGTIAEDSATFEWIGTDPAEARSVTKYMYRKDSGVWMDNDPLTGTSYQWTGFSEGEHTFDVKAIDNEGAESNIITWRFLYVKPKYEITLESSPSNGGLISLDGSDWKDFATVTVSEDSEVELEATPAECYLFEGFYENGIKISSEPTFSILADSTRTIHANFIHNLFIEDFEGAWDWESTLSYSWSGGEDKQYGSLDFRLSDGQLDFVNFSIFGTERFFSYNGDLYGSSFGAETESTYTIENNYLTMSSTGNYWIAHSTITVNEGNYSGELRLSSHNNPDNIHIFNFTISRKENAQLSDIEGTWNITGKTRQSGETGEEDYIGQLKIPGDLQTGDVIELTTSTFGEVFSKKTRVQSIWVNEPRCFSLSAYSDDYRSSIYLKYKENGEIEGAFAIQTGPEQYKFYTFTGEKRQIKLTDFEGAWDWESTRATGGENFQCGRLLFDFNEEKELQKVTMNIFEISNSQSPTGMNLDIFEIGKGDYIFNNNELILTYADGNRNFTTTFFIDNGKYTGKFGGVMNSPGAYETQFLIRREINADPVDLYGTWNLSGNCVTGEDETFSEYTGVLEIPENAQSGDIISLNFTIGGQVYEEDFSLSGQPYLLKPRAFNINGTDIRIQLKYSKHGYIVGRIQITKDNYTNWYMFEGLK